MQFIWPWQDRRRRFSWLKAGAFALVLLPGVRFSYQFGTGEYGSLPIALGNIVYWSGVYATAVLLLALAVTPALRILRWPALVDVRRMIGVTALVYTIAHLIVYFALRLWNFSFIANELVTRATMIAALASTFGLIVLGVTSLDAAIAGLGAKNWQRLHNTNYVITGLAVLHIILARGTYPEQYMLTGVFVWLMAWRVLDRYGKGVDPWALTMLAVGSSVVTALLEAGFLWGRRGYNPLETLGYNFTLTILDLGVPPAWQVLALGLLAALAAAVLASLRLPRLRATRLEMRKAG